MNVCALLSLSVLSAKAQTTYMEMEQLTFPEAVEAVADWVAQRRNDDPTAPAEVAAAESTA